MDMQTIEVNFDGADPEEEKTPFGDSHHKAISFLMDKSDFQLSASSDDNSNDGKKKVPKAKNIKSQEKVDVKVDDDIDDEDDDDENDDEDDKN